MVELIITHNLDHIFQALADPTRRGILHLLSEGERSVGELAMQFKKMTLAAVSKHIQVLERAKLIRRRRNGIYSYIRLDTDALKSAEEWVAHYQHFWGGQLTSLKQYVEENNDESRS